MTGQDVPLATTDELIAELKRRSLAVLVVRAELTKVKAEDRERFFLDYGGGFTAAVGLASRAHAALLADAGDELVSTNGGGDAE